MGEFLVGFILGAIVAFIVIIKELPDYSYDIVCNGKSAITMKGNIRHFVSSNGCELTK